VTMRPRLIIAAITVGCLGVAGLLSVVWFFDADGVGRFEPAVQSLGLLAGITGLVLERRAAVAEHREQAVDAIADELRANDVVLGRYPFVDTDPATSRTVYPRLRMSAVDAALSSGALSQRDDDVLVRALHSWRDEVDTFSHQLTVAELLAFTDGSPQVLRDLYDGLHGADGRLAAIREQLRRLRAEVCPGG
jgi:hypothetical protein